MGYNKLYVRTIRSVTMGSHSYRSNGVNVQFIISHSSFSLSHSSLSVCIIGSHKMKGPRSGVYVIHLSVSAKSRVKNSFFYF